MAKLVSEARPHAARAGRLTSSLLRIVSPGRWRPTFRTLIVGFLALGLAAANLTVFASSANAADPCVSVRFIALRGSGEAGGVTGNAAAAEYNAVKGYAPVGTTTALTGVDYAAVGLENLGKKLNLWRYESSKSGGVRNLATYLNTQKTCLSEKWVFLGFSQGAHVIADSLSASDGTLDATEQDKVAAVVLLADPRFNSREMFDAGTFRVGRNGLLGARPVGDLTRAPGKIKSWCDAKDPVCQDLLGSDSSVHDGTRYAAAYKDAINSYIRAQLGWYDQGSTASGYTGPIDVAFAIDTTGSMGGYIDQVRAAAVALFGKLKSGGADARVGLVDYKDAEYDPYDAQVDLPFTADANAFSTALNGLSAQGGGDTPEYVLSGIQKAIDGLSWRNGAKKIIVVLGDASGKDPEPVGGLTSAKVLQAAYNLDPAQVYPVVLSGDATDFMQKLANGSAGTLFPVTDPTTVVDVLGQALLTATSSPVAVLSPMPASRPGQEVTLSAASSYDPAGRALISYGWDFNGDGTIDASTAIPITIHTYQAPFTGTAAVTVTNDAGTAATGSTPVTVTDDSSIAPASPPSPVTALAATAVGSTVNVTWTGSLPPVDGYEATLTPTGSTSPGAYALAGSTESATSFIDVPDGTYTVSVSAGNDAGLSDPRTAEVTVNTTTPPAADSVTITITATERPKNGNHPTGSPTWAGPITKGDMRVAPRGTGKLVHVYGLAWTTSTGSTADTTISGLNAWRTASNRAPWRGFIAARHGQSLLYGRITGATRVNTTTARVTATGLLTSGHVRQPVSIIVDVLDAADTPFAHSDDCGALPPELVQSQSGCLGETH